MLFGGGAVNGSVLASRTEGGSPETLPEFARVSGLTPHHSKNINAPENPSKSFARTSSPTFRRVQAGHLFFGLELQTKVAHLPHYERWTGEFGS
jgi:hypothetical protein